MIQNRTQSKFTLEEATNAQRGLEEQLYSFFKLGTRWGELSKPRPGRFTSEKDPEIIVTQVRVVIKSPSKRYF